MKCNDFTTYGLITMNNGWFFLNFFRNRKWLLILRLMVQTFPTKIIIKKNRSLRTGDIKQKYCSVRNIFVVACFHLCPIFFFALVVISQSTDRMPHTHTHTQRRGGTDSRDRNATSWERCCIARRVTLQRYKI